MPTIIFPRMILKTFGEHEWLNNENESYIKFPCVPFKVAWKPFGWITAILWARNWRINCLASLASNNSLTRGKSHILSNASITFPYSTFSLGIDWRVIIHWRRVFSSLIWLTSLCWNILVLFTKSSTNILRSLTFPLNIAKASNMIWIANLLLMLSYFLSWKFERHSYLWALWVHLAFHATKINGWTFTAWNENIVEFMARQTIWIICFVHYWCKWFWNRNYLTDV